MPSYHYISKLLLSRNSFPVAFAVDGRWSEWQKWSVCSRSCGSGIQTRARTCDSPRPAHGGKQCPGASGETRFCNTNDCPGTEMHWNVLELKRFFYKCYEKTKLLKHSRTKKDCLQWPNSKLKTFFFSVDGNWSGWKPWGPCTKSCSGGSQTSSRTCTNPPPTNGGEECRGENERSRDCNTQPCPGKSSVRFGLCRQKILGHCYTDMQLIPLELIHWEYDLFVQCASFHFDSFTISQRHWQKTIFP